MKNSPKGPVLLWFLGIGSLYQNLPEFTPSMPLWLLRRAKTEAFRNAKTETEEQVSRLI